MLTIKLRRAGRRNRPFYHIVVAEKRSKATGKFTDKLGHYDPILTEGNFKLDTQKLNKWLAQGATLSPGITKLFKHFKIKTS
ncbi:MAG: 30S ribosomal protein S16 [bacterium]|nr:30S ribosomal protein S16 [bacterium]